MLTYCLWKTLLLSRWAPNSGQFNPEGSTIAVPHFAILFNSAHLLNNIKWENAQLLVQVATTCSRPGAFTTNSL